MFKQRKKILITCLLLFLPFLITLFLKFFAYLPRLIVAKPKYQLIFAVYYKDPRNIIQLSPTEVDLTIKHAKMTIPGKSTNKERLKKLLRFYLYNPYMDTIRYLKWEIVDGNIFIPELIDMEFNHELTSPDGYVFSIASMQNKDIIVLNKNGNLIKLLPLLTNQADNKVSLIGWNISKKYPYCK